MFFQRIMRVPTNTSIFLAGMEDELMADMFIRLEAFLAKAAAGVLETVEALIA